MPSASRFLVRACEQAARQHVTVGLAVAPFGGDEHFAMFLEVHQPIGHGKVVDVEQRADALERRRIFAVRIDHHDMTLRRQFADLVQDQRGAGRFTGTGRPEQREMLAEHRIDIQRAANILGRIDGADFDMRALVGGINLFEVGAGRRKHLAARDRIAGDAAAEIRNAAGDLFLFAFAQEVDRRNDQPFAALVQLLVADTGDQPDIADADLDLRTDLPRHGDGGVGRRRQFADRHRIEQDARGRTRNIDHFADHQIVAMMVDHRRHRRRRAATGQPNMLRRGRITGGKSATLHIHQNAPPINGPGRRYRRSG